MSSTAPDQVYMVRARGNQALPQIHGSQIQDYAGSLLS
jgi:hypothetical protein